MDFDKVLKGEDEIKDESKRKKYEDNFLKEIGQDVKEVFGKGAKITIATRSGLSKSHDMAYKISFRVYVRGVGYFDSSQHCGEFMELKFAKYWKNTLDSAPYSEGPNMGMLFNTKHGDPRILEPLIKPPRVGWPKAVRTSWGELSEEKREELLKFTIIQNVEKESKCLNIKNSKVGQKKSTTIINENSELFKDCENVIERTLKCARDYMPNLETRKIMDKQEGTEGEYILLEFMKNSDTCAICKYAHKNNRAYAIVFPNAAYLKCHKAGKDAKQELFNSNRGKKNIGDYMGPTKDVRELLGMMPTNMEDSDQSADESDFSEDKGDSVQSIKLAENNIEPESDSDNDELEPIAAKPEPVAAITAEPEPTPVKEVLTIPIMMETIMMLTGANSKETYEKPCEIIKPRKAKPKRSNPKDRPQTLEECDTFAFCDAKEMEKYSKYFIEPEGDDTELKLQMDKYDYTLDVIAAHYKDTMPIVTPI